MENYFKNLTMGDILNDAIFVEHLPFPEGSNYGKVYMFKNRLQEGSSYNRIIVSFSIGGHSLYYIYGHVISTNKYGIPDEIDPQNVFLKEYAERVITHYTGSELEYCQAVERALRKVINAMSPKKQCECDTTPHDALKVIKDVFMEGSKKYGCFRWRTENTGRFTIEDILRHASDHIHNAAQMIDTKSQEFVKETIPSAMEHVSHAAANAVMIIDKIINKDKQTKHHNCCNCKHHK